MLRKGFTLLEVLLALAVFSIISIATVRQISLIRNTKMAAFDEIELYNGIRASFSIMKTDLSQAFHVLIDDLDSDTRKSLAKNEQVPHTLFDGRKSEIVFTTLSNRNYYVERKETEQSEVSYYLQKQGKSQYFSLMKRQSGLIDGNLYAGGNSYSILDSVGTLEFHYWDDKAAKWVDAWNSDQGNYRDKFPMAIKMDISVMGKQSKEIKFQTVFKVAFPNNEKVLVKFQ